MSGTATTRPVTADLPPNAADSLVSLTNFELPPQDEIVDLQLNTLIDDIQRGQYRAYLPALESSLRSKRDLLLASLSEAFSELRTSLLSAKKYSGQLNRRKRRITVITIAIECLITAALAVLVFGGFRNQVSGYIYFGKKPHNTLGLRQVVEFALGFAGLSVMLTVMVLRRGFKAQLVRNTARAQSALNSYRQILRDEADGICKLALNDVLGPKNILPFPELAPSLVELDSRKIVPFRTRQRVQEFLLGHESSAVGLAGPRGAGKSTIMAALLGDRRVAQASTLITAPVKYDAADFIRRLLVEVATAILGPEGTEFYEERQRRMVARVAILRMTFGLSAILIALLLFYLQLLEPRTFLVRVTAITIIAAIVGGYGLVLILQAVLSNLDRRPLNRSFVTQMAWDTLEEQLYTREISRSSRNSLKLFHGLLGTQDEDSLRLATKNATLPDLAARLKKLLAAFVNQRDSYRYLVLVDELDKLDSADALIDAINNLKDLFHTRGVHFLISVSTDALLNFEQRGLPRRDAFDSSFDTIIEVEPLTPTESIELISARAEGFPPLVAVCCHALGGGLPREVVRAARRCVEIQRASDDAVPVTHIIHELVTRDLITLCNSLIRTSADDSFLCDYLWLIAKRLSEISQSLPEKAELDVPELQAEAPRELKPFVQFARLTLAFVALLRERLKGSSAWQEIDKSLLEVSDLVAIAVQRRGDEAHIRDYAYDRAATACVNYRSLS